MPVASFMAFFDDGEIISYGSRRMRGRSGERMGAVYLGVISKVM